MIRWFEFVWNIELFGVDVRKQKFLHHGSNQNGHGHGKVMNRCSNALVAAEGRCFEATEGEYKCRGSETKEGTEQGNLHVLVIWIIGITVVRFVVGIEISEDTNLRKWITNGVHYKNTDNQQGKDLVSKASCETDHTSDIKKACQQAIEQKPRRNPCIEGEERNIDVLGNANDSLGKCQNRTSRSNDALFQKNVLRYIFGIELFIMKLTLLDSNLPRAYHQSCCK